MLPRTFIYFLFIDLTSAGSSEQLPVYVVDCMLTVAAAVAVLLSMVAAKSTHFRRKSWHIRNEFKHSFKGFYILKKNVKTRLKQDIAFLTDPVYPGLFYKHLYHPFIYYFMT